MSTDVAMLKVSQARTTLLKKTPVIDHEPVKFFPAERMQDLLFRGFIVPGKQKEYAEYLRRVQPILDRYGAKVLLYGRTRLVYMGGCSQEYCGLIGYRDEFLTDTKGTGLLNSYFDGYDAYRGDFPSRFTGSIVSDRQGTAVAYALFNLEPRGRLFMKPGDPVYEGQIFGEHNRPHDLNANPCKEKKLTNMRATGHEENVILTPVKPMTLEGALHFIREDEMVEVTPLSIRLRKTILTAQRRQRKG
jgi:predicted membrane GTPase involved in stress response